MSVYFIGQSRYFFICCLSFLLHDRQVATQGVPARITTPPRDQRAVDGDIASFLCVAEGSPHPEISWYHGSRKITSKNQRYLIVPINEEQGTSGPSSRGSVLRVEIAKTKMSEGEFECRAENGLGEPVIARANLTVYPEGRVPDGYPRILQSPSVKSVEKNRNTALVCSAVGEPQVTIRWYRNYIPLDTENNPRYSILSNGAFQVVEAQESDEGKYECAAENSLGVKYSLQANLYVKERMVHPYFSIPPEDVEAVPGGDVNLTCVAVGSPMPYVKWRQGSQEVTPEDQVPIGKNVLTLTNIQRSANYTCVATSIIGVVEKNVEVKVKDLPMAPVNLFVSEVSHQSVRLQWSASGTDPVDFYVIHYRPRSSGRNEYKEVTGIRHQSHVINGLDPYTTYDIEVMTSNSIGRSLPSEIAQVTTLQAAPGSPPRNIRSRPVSQISVSVQWEEPIKPNGIITGYTICYTLSPDAPLTYWSRVSVNNTLSATLSDLVENRTYSIAMYASTSVGDGPVSDYIQVRTQKGVPGQPQNFRAEAVSDKVIRLSWSPPVASGERLDSYEIYYSGAGELQHASVAASKDSYVIGNLQSNTEYSIRMSAKSPAGEGAKTSEISVKTLEAAPSGAPLDVNAEAVDSTTLRISWSAPVLDQQNGHISGYRVNYAPLSEKDLSEDSVVTQSAGANDREFILRDLGKWTEYRVWVNAFTRSGDGPPSVVVTARTDEDLPGEPTNVRLRPLNSSAVSVEWHPPADNERNGIIRGYFVYYAPYDEVLESGKFMQKEITGDSDRETTIEGLQARTQYQVQVAAYTRKGDGTRSRPKKVRTKELKGTSLGAPRQLTLRQSSANPPTVTVRWEPPRGFEPGSLSYRIEWSSHESDKEPNSHETTQTTFVTNDLAYGMEYEFRVMASVGETYGEDAIESIVTAEGSPVAAPENVKAVSFSATSIRLTWSPLPLQLSRGVVTLYEIRYSLPRDVIGRSTSSTTATFKVVDGLAANQLYVVQVRACTAVGCGPWSDTIQVQTQPRRHLDVPSDIVVKRDVPTSLLVSWTAPNASNIVGYRVYCSRTDDPDLKNWNKCADSEAASTKVRVTGLMPSSQYYIRVQAKIDLETFGSWSESVVVKAQVTSDSYGVRSLKATAVLDSSVTLHWLQPAEPGVEYYLVEHSGEYLRRYKRNVLPMRGERNIPSTSTLTTYHNLQPNVSYTFSVVAKFTGGYLGPPISVKYPPMEEEESGEELLHTGTAEVDSFQLLLILAPVCVGIVVILLIILIVVYVRRKRAVKKVSRPQSKALLGFPVEIPPPYTDTLEPVEMGSLQYNTQSWQQHPPIPVERFAAHVEALRANDCEKFLQEYESIEPGQTFTWEASNMECNSEKNRYANVVAYDHSRVTLQNGFYGSDYINANYIKDASGQKAYIATQGPLESTAADFWQMVWEQFSPTIVMMTKLEERNRIKCDRYWPNYGTETYGHINVTLIDYIELATYTMRVFNISEANSTDKRTVHQFQFTSWPDHGVPDYPTPLLQFIRRVKTLTPRNEGPVIVHCSAGVGRTGAYIAIDAMLDRILEERLINIYSFVTHMRAQRNYMVQTEDQYMFIHDSILEAIKAWDAEVPADRLYIHVQQLTKEDPEHGCTKMELEFRRLNERKVDPSKFISANLPCNRSKNRLLSILPFDSTRVCLQMIRGVEGSDYINANYIDGYQQKRAYIATQGPMEDTTEDFWRMLWENNCTVVVMLTNLIELGKEKCYHYWPEERPATYKYFAVEPVQRYQGSLCVCREFKVTDVRSGESRTLRQYHFTDWPEQGVPNSGEKFVEFIGTVQKMRDQFGRDGPITVHCSHGVGRTGVFIALSIVLERMRSEGVIDLYQTVNMLRTQRPGMVQNEDQYAFCHRAALEYLSSFDHYGSPMYNSIQ